MISGNVFSQKCIPSTIPFHNGEQIDYDVYYNMGKIWVPAGRVRFTANDTIYNKQNCFFFDGKGKSLKNYDWFFKVRDRYSAIVEKEKFQPLRFTRNVNEGSFSLYYDYVFDNKNKKAKVYEDRKDNSKYNIIDFPNCSYDVMTSVYYARTLDYSAMKVNDSIPLTMMVDKEIYNSLHIKYLGRDTIEDQYGKKYSCLIISPLLIEGTIFKEGDNMKVYITDDLNRIPIYIEAEILVGSIKAYVKSIKNLKHPLNTIK